MLTNGQHIGRYQILLAIGAGGMGEVYLAEDTRLDRKVALKILPKEFAKDKDRMNRFVREAKSASALNHPNIITIHEIGESDGTHFIATEFIDGKTLSDYAKANPLDYKSALEIAIQIASALDEAHSAGIVHRDIKPDNVMIRANGLVKILDFGIAKLSVPTATDGEAATAIQSQTQAGMIIGTPQFMSPEQARGKDVDHQTDIFSFGVVFYEMLSGASPFKGETVSDVIAAVLTKEPPRLNDIPKELAKIVSKTLQKDKRKRYQTANDLLRDLKEVRQELEIQDRFGRNSAPNPAEPKTQILKAQTTAKNETQNSIAVLPFTNMSADEENEYFCDGLAEELLNALAKIDDLKVAARTSAFSFKGKNVEVSEIGEALNVKTVLEGSVRKSGNKLRITVQLINAADGYHLWSERYDREMRDIFDVQDEIALAVVDALKVKLFGEKKAAVLKRYTNNTEAYELYLKGLHQSNKYTPEGWTRAIKCFEKAIEKEPEYAAAYARKSYCQHYLYYYAVVSPDEIVDEWRTTTNRALELDASGADAHLSLAKFYFYRERDWTRAEREFKRAIELTPNSADARQFYGMFLAARSRTDEAIREGEIALELDPLSLPANLHVAWIYWASDHFDDTLRQAERMLEIEPNFFGAYLHTGTAHLGKENYEAAVEAFQKASALAGTTYALSFLGWAYALAGKREEALAVIDHLLDARNREFMPAFNIARVYGGLDETNKTYEWLEKALDEHNGELVYLDAISKTGNGKLWGKDFRADSRFQKLMWRINLPTRYGDKSTNETSEAQTAILSPATTELQETPATLAKTDEQISQKKSKTKRNWLLIVLLSLVVSTAGFFAYRYFTPNSKQIESIAVLPFENASGNADLDYLSDGVSESVIDRLSQLPQLKVIARSSSFRYRGQDLNLQEIANTLGVQAIVTGRVVQRGDSYLIRVDVTDVRENKQLWGENFNRKISDIQILQTDISREIAENLRLKLSGAQTEQIASQGTTNPQAYELRLKGRYYFYKTGIENYHKAVEYYEQAIALDPNYALAYAELADGFAFGGGRGLTRDERRAKVEAAARKALELDANLAEAHFAMAQWKIDNWEWAEGERESKRAIELKPNLAKAYSGYARYLSLMERHDEAIAAAKRGQELSPLTLIQNWTLGDSYARAGQIDKAIEAYKNLIELDANASVGHWKLGDAYAAKGIYAAAINEYQEAIRLRGSGDIIFVGATDVEAVLGAAYAKSGNRAKAEEILQKLKDKGRDEIAPRSLAILYAVLGRSDEAFAQLEKSFAEHSSNLPFIAVEPIYDNLRSDPRFRDLRRRMGLQQQ